MNNQKISTVLNLVLLVAVIFLFVKVYSGPTTSETDTATAGGKKPGKDSSLVNTEHKEDGVLVIAYMNVDSLNSQYKYLDQLEKEFEVLQKEAEQKYQAKINAAQNRAKQIEKDFAIMTLSQQKAAQDEMAKMERDIQMAEKTIFGPLQEKAAMQKEMIHRTLRNYLREYCISNNIDYVLGDISAVNFILYANPAMDITEEVIAGLNKEYEESLK